MKTLADIPDLNGKKVLLRVDFDVPVGPDGDIQEEFRITKQRDTLQYLVNHGARVVMVGHIKSIDSFEPLINQLQRVLGVQTLFCKNISEVQAFLGGPGSIALMENLRANPGEEANDADFARQLAQGFDLYVNNAFAVCHRAHASVATVPTLLPSYAGLQLKAEVEQLAKFIDAPAEGKVIYMAGAKASTKIPVIKYLISKAQAIAVGGVLANDILAGKTDIDAHDPRLHLPTDFAKDSLDIGPQTAAAFAALATGAKLIVWNGPMGKFEDDQFMAGTKTLAQAISTSGAFTVIGGGDTIAAVDKLGLLSTMGFVSTGGGAMLAFLAGTQLPGLQALG